MTTLTMNGKRTATERTGAPHRTKPTRRSVHRQTRAAGRATTSDAVITVERNGLITIDNALLTEARNWSILVGVSLLGWLVAAIAFGVV